MVFDDRIEKIKAHYLNPAVALTAKDLQIKKRLEMVFTWMADADNPTTNAEIVKKIMAVEGISYVQAHRAINQVQDLFGDILASKKEIYSHILYDLAMKTYQMAANAKELREMNYAVKNMIKIKGLDRDDAEMPDMSKIQPPVQILQINLDFLTSKYSGMIDQDKQDEINTLILKINSLLEKSIITDTLPTIKNAGDNKG